MTKEISLGVNRGRPRLWLEGQWLAEGGFTRHARYTVAVQTDRTLKLVIAPDGERKVSGKTKKDGSDHPIIDFNGSDLQPYAGVVLSLTIAAGVITIRVKG